MFDFLKPYRLIIYGVLLISLLGILGTGVHKYNEMLRDDGRNEVTAEWMEKSKVRAAQQEALRKRLEGDKRALSKQYHAELAVRQDLQQKLNKEQENAIRESAVADLICFDDRMLNSWNQSGGHAGTSGTGAAGRGVDAKVPSDASKVGR